jgi:hypothetical protein
MLQASRFILPLILMLNLLAAAQTDSTSIQSAQSSTEQSFDIKAAVDAYLTKMPPAQRVTLMPTSSADTGSCCGIFS